MTIEEIAKELGVSKSTLSRALTGNGRQGEETRRRILQFAAQAGRRAPQETARRPERALCLGLVIPADVYISATPFFFFQDCMLGVSETASQQQCNVMLVHGARNDVSHIRALVESGAVDGFLFMRGMEDDLILRYLSELPFPTAVTGHTPYEGIIQVDSDNEAAAESLVSLLIGQGYRRFALLAGDMDFEVNVERCRGFFRALERHGIDRDTQYVYQNVTDLEDADTIISEALVTRVSCIVCGDDILCTRVMSGLQAKRFRIPRDISVVSLYNSTNLQCFTPAVTAVNISGRRMGETAAKQLIARMQGRPYNEKTKIDYEILFRQSVGTEGRG